jgi:Holliday junction resolvasome RuvABC endonuclease subunit
MPRVRTAPEGIARSPAQQAAREDQGCRRRLRADGAGDVNDTILESIRYAERDKLIRYVIGFDPGIAKFGVAVIGVHFDGATRLAEGKTIITEAASKKRGVRSADDAVDRVRLIAKQARNLVNIYRPVAAATETLSHVRNSAAMAKIGMVLGALIDMCDAQDIPLFHIAPKQLKQGLGLKPTADKTEVIQTIKKRFGTFNNWPTASAEAATTEIQSHLADAAGAATSLLAEPSVRLALKF